MKKTILVLAMVFATVGMANANESISKEKTNFDDGGASECAQFARGVILKAADEYNLDISRGGSHFELMMEAYHAIYLDCYTN